MHQDSAGRSGDGFKVPKIQQTAVGGLIQNRER